MKSPYTPPLSSIKGLPAAHESRPLWKVFWLIYLPGFLLTLFLSHLLKEGFWMAWVAYQVYVAKASLIQMGFALHPGLLLSSLMLRAAPFVVFFPWIIKIAWRCSRNTSREIFGYSARAAVILGLLLVAGRFVYEASSIIRIIFP
jgi:hypothetical protein